MLSNTTIMLSFAIVPLVVGGRGDAEPQQISQEKAGKVSKFVPVKLPDGTDFKTWERPMTFTRTYQVAQQHPRASDDNPGTVTAPWRTIFKAADVLQPAERVIVHESVYREWVKPARGGTEPDKMISYEAAPGEHVVIKDSELWKPKWEKNRHHHPLDVVTWEATIDQELFGRGHAFSLRNALRWRGFARTNGSSPTFQLRRGQMFVDGVQFTQLIKYDDLGKHEGHSGLQRMAPPCTCVFREMASPATA